MNVQQQPSILPWLVFIPTLVLVLFALAPVVFPSIIQTSGIKFPAEINAFEFGLWSAPLLIVNGLVFGILSGYTKMPSSMRNLLNRIFSFEVSARTALLFFLTIIGIFAALGIGELSSPDPWEDFNRTFKPALDGWDPSGQFSKKTMVYFLANLSMDVFGNYRTIPFVSSIAILVLVYLTTLEISKKRFAGLVSMAVVAQSGNFLTYDTTITYPNFWVVFYLLSLYFVFKKWQFCAISLIFSAIAKAFSLAFLPFALSFAALAEIPRRKKALVLISYFAVAVAGLIFLLASGDFHIITSLGFDFNDMARSITILSSQFRYDGMVVVFLLPVVYGLFIKARRGYPNATSVLSLIFGVLLLAFLVPSLTTYTNSPYRFLFLVTFFAIGVGTIFSKKDYPAGLTTVQ
jgi:hypothetical protein